MQSILDSVTKPKRRKKKVSNAFQLCLDKIADETSPSSNREVSVGRRSRL